MLNVSITCINVLLPTQSESIHIVKAGKNILFFWDHHFSVSVY
jgi:hypothetical protein